MNISFFFVNRPYKEKYHPNEIRRLETFHRASGYFTPKKNITDILLQKDITDILLQINITSMK
ncbi:MAG: hypothetical protein U9P79_02215 [Candidatus Cloacimonadota bacterium]|nr:hypothetical protein [Candidatus Cloacimonadota bacterium]